MKTDLDRQAESALAAASVRTPDQATVRRTAKTIRRNRLLAGGLGALAALSIGVVTMVAFANSDDAGRVTVDGDGSTPAVASDPDSDTSVPAVVPAPELVNVDGYHDPMLETDPLFALVPNPADFGPGWNGPIGSIMALSSFLEIFGTETTESAGPECDVAPAPEGQGRAGYLEYGFDDVPDDGSLILAQGTDPANRWFFDVLATSARNGCDGARVQIKTPPEIAGALEVLRYSSVDSFSQFSENIIVLGDGFMFHLSVYLPDGRDPVDVDALAKRAVANYAETN